MVLNAVLAFGLAPALGWMAPAIATTASGWAMVLLLWWGSRNMGEVARFDDRVRKRLPRILLASGIMGIALWALVLTLGPWLSAPTIRYFALLALILGGAVAFFGAAQLLGGLSLRELRQSLRRSK